MVPLRKKGPEVGVKECGEQLCIDRVQLDIAFGAYINDGANNKEELIYS